MSVGFHFDGPATDNFVIKYNLLHGRVTGV